MTAEELRELAARLDVQYSSSDTDRAAAYLRACADALDAGPVAWHYDGRDQIEVYPLAMPAQAQPLRLPEPLTDEEVAALIDETEGMETDRAVRYLVETGVRRVKEANDAAAAPTPPAQKADEAHSAAVSHLYECLGQWSAGISQGGELADLAPPSWLIDAINAATLPRQAARRWRSQTRWTTAWPSATASTAGRCWPSCAG